MNCSWTNKTMYDDDGLCHLIERVVQTSHQMHASDPYEDHEPVDIQSVLIDYSDSGGIFVNLEQTDLLVCIPDPAHLWSEIEALEILSAPRETQIPPEVIRELAGKMLTHITSAMAVFRGMQRIGGMKNMTDISPWAQDITAPCKITINKEAI